MTHIGYTLRTLRILVGLPLAEVARRSALDERSVRKQAVRLVSAFETEAGEAPMRAAVAIATELDRAFATGRPGLVRAVLVRLTPANINGDAMVGLPGTLRRPCEVFGSDLMETGPRTRSRAPGAGPPRTWRARRTRCADHARPPTNREAGREPPRPREFNPMSAEANRIVNNPRGTHDD